MAVDEDCVRSRTVTGKTESTTPHPARKATPRDILRPHLKQWEVLACASELKEYSPRAKQIEDLPSMHAAELYCLSSPSQRTEVRVRFLTISIVFIVSVSFSISVRVHPVQ